MNLTGPLIVEAKSVGEATVLAEIVRLLEAAEQKKGRYMAFADKVVRWYSPTVHALSLGAFLGWWLFGGMAVPEALMIAVCVLIITCPCALGLAVPITQVVAAGRLSRQGVLVKSETALERYAAIDTIVFDKTGTLTTLEPRLVGLPDDEEALQIASSIAASSKHPRPVDPRRRAGCAARQRRRRHTRHGPFLAKRRRRSSPWLGALVRSVRRGY